MVIDRNRYSTILELILFVCNGDFACACPVLKFGHSITLLLLSRLSMVGHFY